MELSFWFLLESLFFGLVSLLIYWGYGVYCTNKILKHIPGPFPVPFVSVKLPTNAFEIYTFFDGLVKKYGKTFKVYLGPNLSIVTCDTKLLEPLLKSTVNITKSSGYDMAKDWMENGIIVSTGEKWRQRRKLTNPSFHSSLLKEFFNIFRETAETLIKTVEKYAETGKQFDAMEYMSKFSFDVVGETTLGIKLNVLKGENQDYMRAVDSLTKITYIRNFSIWKRFDLPFRLFAQEKDEYMWALKLFHDTSSKIIEDKRKEYSELANKGVDEDEESRNKKKAILIDALMVDSDLSDGGLREELNTFLMAGTETTSLLVCFALYELAHDQAVQDKLYQELESYTGNDMSMLTYDNLSAMKYLDQVVKETLRLRSPASVIERQLEESFQYDKTVLPKGINITILLYWLHLDPEVFPDPHKFDPERFSPENQEKIPPCAFIPFSSGPRNCIGQAYSILEAKIILATMMMNYKIVPVEGSKIVIGISGVVRSKYGFPIKIERRTRK